MVFTRHLSPFGRTTDTCTTLKNMENIHGGVLLLVKLQALAYNFTKSNTPPFVFLTFFKGIPLFQCFPVFYSSKSILETLEKGAKYGRSQE